MTQQFDDDFWMQRAREVAFASDDPDKKVGCVIVNPRTNRLVMNGANTLADGVKVTHDRVNKPNKYDWIEHAERNAIFRAARTGISLNGMTMYLPWFPCVECARAIMQAGIARLVCTRPDFTHHKWGHSHEIATEMLVEGGYIELDYYVDAHLATA